ncbi:MAG TPA: hypothetical protein VK509_07805, partial [Polyangiales bacterium]|nr:hypothetical protein [Polyangiales bacterium]
AAALVAAVFFTTPVTEYRGGYDYDGVFYAAMANGENGIEAHLAPWGYRVLTPFLAGQLPWSTLTNFRALALVTTFVELILFGWILGRLGFSPTLRVFGVLLYAGVFWTLKFSFYAPAYIDYQTRLLLLAIIALTLAERPAWLLLVFALGALQKEALVAFVPFAVATMLLRGSPLKAWLRGALLVVACAAALIAVRTHVIVANPDQSQAQLMLTQAAEIFAPARWPMLLQAAFSGLGLLPALLIASARGWTPFLRAHREWCVYGAIAVILLAGGLDKARLFLYLLPLAVILTLTSISALERGLTPPAFWLWAAPVLVVHFYLGGYLGPVGNVASYLAKFVPEHASNTFVPYLIRNVALSVVVAWATRRVIVPLVAGASSTKPTRPAGTRPG